MEYINLDITPGSIPPIVNCSQCDIGREIALILFDGTSGEWSIPEGSTVYIIGTKSDGHPFGYDSVSNPDIITWTGSTVTVKTVYQMTAAAGEAECEVRIKSSAQEIYTANFILDVESMAWPQDDELSTIDIPLIVRAVNATTNSEENANKAAASEKAAATSETNAKTSETNAKASETAAAKSETAAKNSETNASKSETNAKTSETNAKTSETNAKASETNASKSEQNAKTSETNAKDSENLSKSYAVGGTGVRSGEDTDNSKYYKEQAESYMKTAESYATSDYATQAKSYAVGGTGTRENEDTDNAAWYYEHIKDTDVAHLAELEKKLEDTLTKTNHDLTEYPAFFADRLADVADLNACTTNGLYQFTESTLNTPVSGTGLCAAFNSVASGETGYIAQYAWLGDDAHTVYARDDHNGSWGEWKQVGADIINSIAPLKVTTAPTATGTNSIAEGDGAKASNGRAIAIGASSFASGIDSIAVGHSANAVLANAIAIGYEADAKGSSYGVAVGGEANSVGYASVAIGAGAIAKEDNTVSVGRTTSSTDYPLTRRIVNVTDPVNDQDAATKAYVDVVATEVNARPATRKLSTQTLTAEGGTLTWTDSCITDDSLIDVYASIPNIAPSAITQSGTTVTVTFDAQSAAFSVAIVVMN